MAELRSLGIENGVFRINSGFRSIALQRHFRELFEKARDLSSLDGIERRLIAGQAVLELRSAPPPSVEAMVCVSLMNDVNSEIRGHGIKGNTQTMLPAVNRPEESLHTLDPAQAVDISVDPRMTVRPHH